MNLFSKAKKSNYEIEPDEIFLDARNIPEFDTQQFEGRLEEPIGKRSLAALSVAFIIIAAIFTCRIFALGVVRGAHYESISVENSLDKIPLFADRGIIFDRNGTLLVSNSVRGESGDFSKRVYPKAPGFSHVLGYVGYPSKDKSGVYWQKDTIGKSGVEKEFDSVLSGKNGAKLIETNAGGNVNSENVINRPVDGENITLSIDARVETSLFRALENFAHDFGFEGGAGVIMDVHTGELIALSSFPEYDSSVLSEGSDRAEIARYLSASSKPFLNRALGGVYTPGSIVKPYIALGALEEGVIDPLKQILSTGSISVQNPYDPKLKTVFKDNKAHGWVDMRHALAVSSNVYFYEIGGGFESQRGLGIANIKKYTSLFGLGQKTGINLPNEQGGNIPSPEWKAAHFKNDPWRVGDTYNTAIGQYGFQVTPLEMARAVGGVATEGELVVPTILHDDPSPRPTEKISLSSDSFRIVKEGMRLVVTEGTGVALNTPAVRIAAKSGTAQVGAHNEFMNSWITGFFPYENPRYSFAVLVEHGPKTNTTGAAHVMRSVIDDMMLHAPEYMN